MRLPTATTAASRRAVVQTLALLASTKIPARKALAFDNRLPPDELELKYKTPRTAGPKPTDIGVRNGNALKACLDGKPHCFSSSLEFDDDDGADWLVKPFKYDKPLADALSDVKGAIEAYPPGQNGVDGGGFKVITENNDGKVGYLYVQFESLRKGYVDVCGSEAPNLLVSCPALLSLCAAAQLTIESFACDRTWSLRCRTAPPTCEPPRASATSTSA